MIDIAIFLAAGAGLGFLIGLTGVGGGVLTVPVLILILGLDPIMAVGTASLYVVLTKVYAAYRHYRQDTINWRVGFRFLVASLPGVICTALLVKWGKATLTPAGIDDLQRVISYAVLLSLGFSLCTFLIDYDRFKNKFISSRPARAFGVFCVFLIGAVIGATSVGGGILIIPALLLFYGETSKYVGTSILAALLLMVAMSAIYAFVGWDGHAGDVDFRIAGFMAVGSLLGTYHGSALSTRIEPKLLRLIIVGMIILAAAMMSADRFR